MTPRKTGRPPKRRGSLRPNAGRKRIKMSENSSASRSTIDRRAQELLEDNNINEAVLSRALKIIQNRSNNSSNQDNKEVQEEQIQKTIPHSPLSALAFYIENDYTVVEYKNLVEDTKARTIGLPPIYPSYNIIDQQKKKCLEGLKIEEQSEITYRASLQSLLNKSSERLLQSIDDDVNISEEKLQDCEFFISYGFDSSSGHKNTHQRFENDENITYESHQHLFASVLVLLAIKNGNEYLWMNSTPQSTRFCRPIRLSYEKETTETTQREHNRLKGEISTLVPHNFVINEKSVSIKYNLELTLLDGKALNNVLDNDATARCPICELTMKYFNTERAYSNDVPEDHLKHGLGLLHCEIKAFEFFLHLSYRSKLGLKNWNCPSSLKGKYFLYNYYFFCFLKDNLYKDVQKSKFFRNHHLKQNIFYSLKYASIPYVRNILIYTC